MPDILSDAFGSDIFSSISLTDAIQELPFVPGRIGAMGLFQDQGINTTTAMVEERDGLIALVANQPRGADQGQGLTKGRTRVARTFAIPHKPLYDQILAADVQDVRKFGSTDQLESVVEIVNERLATMKQLTEITLEQMRAGAIAGIVFDSDGSTTIFNYYTEYSETENTKNFVFGTASTDIREVVVQVIRLIEDDLGGVGFDHIHCLCSDGWWDAFTGHDDVKAAFDRYEQGAWLRGDVRAGFNFAGVTFENYRGKVGSVDFIVDDKARFFPVGVPNMFKMYYAPADFVEAANTIGLPIYAKQERIKFDKGVELHTQSNPLAMCTRPRALCEGTKT